MTTFIVIHRLPEKATQDEVIGAGRMIADRLSDDIRWLNGWIVPSDGRLLCEWEAPDEEAIRTTLKGANLFPIEAIYAVASIDPAWFAE